MERIAPQAMFAEPTRFLSPAGTPTDPTGSSLNPKQSTNQNLKLILAVAVFWGGLDDHDGFNAGHFVAGLKSD